MEKETNKLELERSSEIERGETELDNNIPIPAEEEIEPHVSAKTWTVAAILSMGYGLSFVPVPAMAAIGPQLSAEFGNPNDYVWFVSAWIISITVCFMIAGANTDLLGRRWFLVLGNLVCCIGQIILAVAKTNSTIIAGMTVTGFGAALCQMATFALTELLPNKWRHIGVVFADIAVYVCITVIPVTARYGYYVGSWRANFIAAAVLQFASFLGLYFFYFPPAHPLGLPYKQVLRELDYVGILLFLAGSLPFLVGIVYATIFPSTDVHVIAPLVIGCAMLVAFALWETYGNTKHPLTPTEIFTNGWGRDFTAPCIALAVINMFYYSSSILWPTMISVFYTKPEDGWQRGAILSLPQGLAITAGGVLLSLFGSKIRHWQHQQTVAVTIMVFFGSLMALARPDNMGMMIAFMTLSLMGYGWSVYLCIAVTQMGVPHEKLGTSGGLSGCARFAGGSIAQAVYLAIFASTVTKFTARLVPAAAMAAGVDEDKISTLFSLLGTSKLGEVFDERVVAAVGAATQEATRKGIQGIAWASLGFGIIGIIACLCCKDVDAKMTNKIEVYLKDTKGAK